MNNHILQTMSLAEAKIKGALAINCWKNFFENEFEASDLVNQIHQRIEALVDMSFDSGKWIVMKHESGAIFPVIIPEGQRNCESWEGLSMSASYMIIKELMNTNPFWQQVYDGLDKAVLVENLETTPFLVS